MILRSINILLFVRLFIHPFFIPVACRYPYTFNDFQMPMYGMVSFWKDTEKVQYHMLTL